MHSIRRPAIAWKPVTGLVPMAHAVCAVAALWLDRARSRRRLAELASRELADIGRTEPERWRECAKWFWQA
jgi:uncharacterized protein YjiS (DUF1127 family)